MEKLDEFCQRIVKLNEEIEDYLVQFVKEHGGSIDTSDDTYSSTIYGFIYDEALNSVTEEKIDSVKVENDSLVIEVNDELYPISGGYVAINVTLYNICQNLQEYIDE